MVEAQAASLGPADTAISGWGMVKSHLWCTIFRGVLFASNAQRPDAAFMQGEYSLESLLKFNLVRLTHDRRKPRCSIDHTFYQEDPLYLPLL
jgi:hypothetical protein